jgi:hypothetical protein
MSVVAGGARGRRIAVWLAGLAPGAGLVHRDVKPANILVDRSPGRPDHPYLSDFGLAKGAAGSAGITSAAGLTGTGQFLGTADYVSFRTDGSLITVGTNGTEYVWEVAARQQTSAIAAPRGHVFQRAVDAVAISAVVHLLATADKNGTTYVWNLPSSPAPR